MIQTVNIETLSAGREMDALVAEKVMGHTVTKERHPIAWKRGKHPSRAGEDVVLWRDYYFCEDKRDSDGDRYIVCHYSTSITAAWEVVEKLCRDEYAAFEIRGTRGHRATFNLPSEGAFDGYSGQNEAPLAICRAAWKAKEALNGRKTN